MTSVGIIDYGMSNIDSVARAVSECGGTPVILSDPEKLDSVAAYILPGVGAFAEGMHHLRTRGFVDALFAEVAGNRIPVLGICLGMQLFAQRGFEGSDIGSAGLSLIRGDVRRLPADERVPHVGWNEVYRRPKNLAADALFAGLEDGRDFYFVHSYCVIPNEDADWAAETPYGNGFCSALARDHVWGVQFHPEKSQQAGFQILRNFIETAC